MSGNFQTQVYTQPAPAVAGDFCDKNPRYTVDAGPGGLVSGSSGLTIGHFAWAIAPLDSDGAPAIVNNTGWGPVTGFVHRKQGDAAIVTYLADASMLIIAGQPVTLFNSGGFWAKNDGTTEAQFGMKAFANVLTGAVSFATTGTNPGGATDSTGGVVNTTLTLVGSVSDNILTVASISAGKPYPGALLSSNAIGQVISQLTNATGAITSSNPADYSVGTYLLDTGEQTVAAGTTIGGGYGLYTISGGTITGSFYAGMILSGTGLTVGTAITYQASGATGSTVGATFVTNNRSTATSTPITGSSAVETKWYARSTGLAGELVKISDQVLG